MNQLCKRKIGGLPLLAILLAATIAVLTAAAAVTATWALHPVDPPRPTAPRADAHGPCADCPAPPLDSTDVVDHIQRPAWRPCPAGFRGAGTWGRDRTCLSDTTFRVSTTQLPDLVRTPGQPPIATCEAGHDQQFEIIVARDASTTEPLPDNPSNARGTSTASCAQVLRMQPELATVERFEVHQLSRLTLYRAETLDTATGRHLEPEHLIGYRRSLMLNVTGTP